MKRINNYHKVKVMDDVIKEAQFCQNKSCDRP